RPAATPAARKPKQSSHAPPGKSRENRHARSVRAWITTWPGFPMFANRLWPILGRWYRWVSRSARLWAVAVKVSGSPLGSVADRGTMTTYSATEYAEQFRLAEQALCWG